MKEQTFQEWMRVVDRIIARRLGGMDSRDLPDLFMVRDWFDDGTDPGDAAKWMLEGWADEGDIPWELIS